MGLSLLSVCLSVGRSVGRSVGLSVCRSVGLSVCRSVGLSVCLSVCLSVSLSLSLPCVCLCENHLNRCKTSNLAGGAGGTDETGTNKDTHQLPVISMGTLIDVPASFFISIFCNGKWPTQKPLCRLEDHELVQMEQLHLART